jgi:ribosomal protein L40E
MRRTLTAFLNLLQPAARLRGRLQSGLTPWRRKRLVRLTLPRRHTVRFWAKPRSHEVWVESVHDGLAQGGAAAVGNRPTDTFDLEERGGTFGAARMMIAVEDHPAGRQFVRLRLWPRWSLWAKGLACAFMLFSAVALADGAWAIAGVFGLMAGYVGLSAYSQSAAALLDLKEAVERLVRTTAVQVPAPAVAVDSSTRAIAIHVSAQGPALDPLEHQPTSETPAAATPADRPRRTPDGRFSGRKAGPSSVCQACGLVLAPSARFCRGCGQRQVRMRPAKVARRKARTTG